MEQNAFLAKVQQIIRSAKENRSEILFSDLRKFFENETLTGAQINKLWYLLDQSRILVFHIDEDDVLFTGLPDQKETLITPPGQESSKKKGFFAKFRK